MTARQPSCSAKTRRGVRGEHRQVAKLSVVGPVNSGPRMHSRWWNVLRIAFAETADASHCVEALLEGGEAAIRPATHAAAAVLGAPRIILGFRAGSHGKRSNEYSQDE